jgi:hypothetical protein
MTKRKVDEMVRHYQSTASTGGGNTGKEDEISYDKFK